MFKANGVAAVLLTIVALLTFTASAHADRRVALVIGNAAYQNAGVLANPRNDAEDMAAALRGVGFEVISASDLDKRGMDAALTQFARAAHEADAALFYFAGHGLQFQGQNFLMPVDARLDDEFGLNYELTRLDDVLGALIQARGVKILVLDACRNNPLSNRLKINSPNRAFMATRGLARIDAARGMVVAYATQPDQVAVDGNGRNSPFTSALVKEIDQPGLEVGTLFRRVAAAVSTSTDGRQLPELSISLIGEFYFSPPAAAQSEQGKAAAEAQTAQREQTERLQRELDALRERVARAQLERSNPEPAKTETAKTEPAKTEPAKTEPAGSQPSRIEPGKLTPKTQTAVLVPATNLPATRTPMPIPSRALIVDIKKELTRVGCYNGLIDERWPTDATRAALDKFARNAGSSIQIALTTEFLGELRKSKRVCTEECSVREVERDGRCVAKACPALHSLDHNGRCIPVTELKPTEPIKPSKKLGRCSTSNGKRRCR